MRKPVSLELVAGYAESWGLWNGRMVQASAWLEQESCRAGLLVQGPGPGFQTIPASGYMAQTFRVEPGSVIWGVFSPDNTSNGTVVQLTDVSLGHRLFQDAIDLSTLRSPNVRYGLFPSYVALPPYPVVGDGLFKFEAWGAPGNLAYVVLGTAGVLPCEK